jgi:hypothetical protein
MNLLSKELVSLEYRERLQRDLAKASVCRFLVAYVSTDGTNSIGRHLLNRVLRDGRSFGVASLACSCGFEPLLRLQAGLSDVRLKYVMDPLVKEEGEPSEISLFHSKLVYLYLEGEAKSIVYIGSHNWTRRALGPRGPRNAEASIRFELDFSPEDVDGSGSSVASDVNRHLLDAWNLPLCLPATADNEPALREWYEKGCRRSPSAPLQENTILLSVRRPTSTANDWLQLAGRGIYLQVLEEEDGQIIWDSGNRVLVLVWNSEADLIAARQPVLLQCRITTSKAGRNSRERGTNRSVNVDRGFEAVIWDAAELGAKQNDQQAKRSPVRLWSGRTVHVYDFEFPTSYVDSSQVDGTVEPNYQFHLEVERVIVPSDSSYPDLPGFVWSAESFSVAASKDAARVEETPGYFVDAERERQMLDCLSQVLFVNPDHAKVLPYSSADRLKVGKRISTHPLHETFLGPEWQQKNRRDEYYQRSEPGALVAELDFDKCSGREAAVDDANQELSRLQRVFTSPINRLVEIWAEAAKVLGAPKHESKPAGKEVRSPKHD